MVQSTLTREEYHRSPDPVARFGIPDLEVSKYDLLLIDTNGKYPELISRKMLITVMLDKLNWNLEKVDDKILITEDEILVVTIKRETDTDDTPVWIAYENSEKTAENYRLLDLIETIAEQHLDGPMMDRLSEKMSMLDQIL
ncbi:hypothetical protein [Bifidobacterium sp. SO1]|uniref:hypothetical protein n=1 Tax=Bifidobacterium sp. SO1 TaxID=2809029 RepID=UPI001BDC963B|nr:hypothetical protein [Bifidobacterium sp. SO1]MBT1163000.1 hypothetical protein [Bifidobacterium sp. SO1]